ncbi:MAG: ATPase, T2SS/T4P/T4SS family [bacterium]|nr:ATPase, T2SS/T4P/T4SS family [bacterium]
MAEEQEPVLNLEEAMERLQLGRAEVYRKVKDGALKAEKIDGYLRFTQAAVEKLAEDLQKAKTSLREALDRALELYRERLASNGETELPDLAEKTDDERLVELCRRILTDGIHRQVTDIHLDPLQSGDRLLYRNAGNLREIVRLESVLSGPLKNKLKTQAALPPPAEGQRMTEKIFNHTHAEQVYQIQISAAPSLLGEHLHMHFYRREEDLSLDVLGYTPTQAEALHRLLTGRPGLFLVAGAADPSADDHRLALAGVLTAAGRLVVSLERRTHYRSELLVQLELKPDDPATFNSTIHAALGMSPDVLMLDDLRSTDEARALLEATSAGAVAVAQLRASGSVQALLWLLDNGLTRDALGRALLGVVERVALRRLCPHCRTARTVTPTEAKLLSVDSNVEIHEPAGCETCGDGFLGRRICYGLLPMDEDLARLLSTPDPLEHPLAAWRNQNPLSAANAARECVLAGETSLDDALPLLVATEQEST